VATGKSRRGLDHLVELHGWGGVFQTVQVADHHPSKPHPSMLLACLAETGVEAGRAVMVGDTSFDMQMAHSAGIRGLGVGWGYHPAAALREARAVDVLAGFDALPGALATLWEAA
jgi:phosphoglycolate phosphatase